MGPERYLKAFNLLKDYIDNGLDLYKVTVRKRKTRLDLTDMDSSSLASCFGLFSCTLTST